MSIPQSFKSIARSILESRNKTRTAPSQVSGATIEVIEENQRQERLYERHAERGLDHHVRDRGFLGRRYSDLPQSNRVHIIRESSFNSRLFLCGVKRVSADKPSMNLHHFPGKVLCKSCERLSKKGQV